MFDSVPQTIEKTQKKYRPNPTPYAAKKPFEVQDEQSCQVIDFKPQREKSTKEQSSFNTTLSPKRIINIARRESPQILRTAGKQVYNSMAPGARLNNYQPRKIQDDVPFFQQSEQKLTPQPVGKSKIVPCSQSTIRGDNKQVNQIFGNSQQRRSQMNASSHYSHTTSGQNLARSRGSAPKINTNELFNVNPKQHRKGRACLGNTHKITQSFKGPLRQPSTKLSKRPMAPLPLEGQKR